ncbi:MAG TPA: PocR ligand-binding domain-containing protein [Deltaproteobacteria bacterium]|nr:PocR ligand-binding domain-containing protein [Deltaproteobacteria bacterium]HQB39235.1 PocR ligand-binding domain-containing protein [Deltaproteobacteria bacterium]
MKKSDTDMEDWEERRSQIIGLGEHSARKSYYPELQQRLRELEQTRTGLADAFVKLQSVLDAASEVSIIATDRDGIITLFNRGAEKMLGYEAKDVVGINTPLIIHAANELSERAQELGRKRHQHVEGFNALVMNSTVDGSETSEWSYIRRDGSKLTVSLSISAIHDAENSLSGFLFIATDISERKSYEDALNKRIVALTEPLETTDITFLDMFDLGDIQRLQDAFADATSVASIITTPDGTPITRPSRFCRLCNDIIRKTDKGLSNCKKSDAVLGRQNSAGPVFQPCLSGGLWDGGASITVGGKHVANWLIGQVKIGSFNEEKLIKYADEIGADKESFRKALQEVPEMSLEQFQHICSFLFLLTSELSLKAFQNIQQARFIGQR